MKTLWRREKGQSMVELALILPILLLLLFGTIEFGRVFYSYITITSAVREGARAAAVGKTDDEIKLRVKEATTLSEVDDRLTFTYITPVESRKIAGGQVKVEIQYNMPLSVPIINQFLPNPLPLRASATMRKE